MKKQNWLHSWPRLLLWSHVAGVLGFYITLWLRTAPNAEAPKIRARANTPDTRASSKKPPFVSIIVPARDEERNIRRCVTSLLEQDYEYYEVIVVDDGSTDSTERILDEIAQTHPRHNRLWILRLKVLPEGWAGKPHALHAGVQEARGDWLLFTDADTWHAPNALRTALSWAEDAQIDMLSLGTQQELPGFWERVMMPMAYIGISMQYPLKKVNDPASSIAIANGQYILLRRAVYDITGGYARPDLRGTLLDDRDLARVVKQNGFCLRLLDGRDLVHVHMYQGLTDTWRGWRKNAFLGSRGGLAFVLLQVVGLPIMTVIPFLLPFIYSMSYSKNRSKCQPIKTGEFWLATALELGPLLAYRLKIDKELKVPWYYAFTHPLAGLLFAGILTQSAWRVLSGNGVDWRGRQYFQSAQLPHNSRL